MRGKQNLLFVHNLQAGALHGEAVKEENPHHMQHVVQVLGAHRV